MNPSSKTGEQADRKNDNDDAAFQKSVRVAGPSSFSITMAHDAISTDSPFGEAKRLILFNILTTLENIGAGEINGGPRVPTVATEGFYPATCFINLERFSTKKTACILTK